MRLNRKLPTIREAFQTRETVRTTCMNDKTAKLFKSFIKRFICGNMKQKRHSFQFRNEQLLLHFRFNGEVPACTLRRCFANYQRCSFRFRNEQLCIFNSARAEEALHARLRDSLWESRPFPRFCPRPPVRRRALFYTRRLRRRARHYS